MITNTSLAKTKGRRGRIIEAFEALCPNLEIPRGHEILIVDENPTPKRPNIRGKWELFHTVEIGIYVPKLGAITSQRIAEGAKGWSTHIKPLSSREETYQILTEKIKGRIQYILILNGPSNTPKVITLPPIQHSPSEWKLLNKPVKIDPEKLESEIIDDINIRYHHWKHQEDNINIMTYGKGMMRSTSLKKLKETPNITTRHPRLLLSVYLGEKSLTYIVNTQERSRKSKHFLNSTHGKAVFGINASQIETLAFEGIPVIEPIPAIKPLKEENPVSKVPKETNTVEKPLSTVSQTKGIDQTPQKPEKEKKAKNVKIKTLTLQEVFFPGIEAKFVTWTPDDAKFVLEHLNPVNRHCMPKAVDRIKNLILDKNFAISHQGIAFDENSHLIDGQTRLNAIVQSNRPITLLTTIGLPPRAKYVDEKGKLRDTTTEGRTQDLVDINRNRSFADILTLNERDNGIASNLKANREIAAIVKGLVKLTAREQSASVQQLLEVLNIYQADIDAIMAIRQACPTDRYLLQAPIASALVLARHSVPQKIDEFVKQLYSGENLTNTQPAFMVRAKLNPSNPVPKTIGKEALLVKTTLYGAEKFCEGLLTKTITTQALKTNNAHTYFKLKQFRTMKRIDEIFHAPKADSWIFERFR